MLILRRMDGNDPSAAVARFPADARAIPAALAAARGFAEAERLGPDTRARLVIVVEELVANLVEHGGAPGAPIELRLVREGGVVALRLTDGGAPFDPRAALWPRIPPERGGGAGLALVRAWARITGYASAAGRNRLDLALPPVD